MCIDRFVQTLGIITWTGLAAAGCNRVSESTTNAKPQTNAASPAQEYSNDVPADSVTAGTSATEGAASESTSANSNLVPAVQQGTSTEDSDGATLKLDGITLTVPPGWIVQHTRGTGPMAPKAVLSIPNANGEPGSVRITHYPGMRGMNEQNVQRWIAQARKPDGSPMTRADATVTGTTLGKMQLTTIDISGTIKATMRATAKPSQRMLATIMDHSAGPHFIVVVGDVDLIEISEPDIMDFFNSAHETPK